MSKPKKKRAAKKSAPKRGAKKRPAKKRAAKKAAPKRSKKRSSKRSSKRGLYPHSSRKNTPVLVRAAGHTLGNYSATSRGLALHIHHHH